MAAKKGTLPPNAGKGRPKGEPNKITRELKDMILGALDKAHPGGGEAYLIECARDPMTRGAFLTLVGKVLPKDINAKVEVSNWTDVLRRLGGSGHD